MNRIDATLARQRNDPRDVEVRANGLAGLADVVGLVGLEAVQCEAVLMGVDRDGADTQLVGGAENANGDFGTIGDEQLAEGLWRFDRHRRVLDGMTPRLSYGRSRAPPTRRSL